MTAISSPTAIGAPAGIPMPDPPRVEPVALRAAARDFESAFIAEMLKTAGFGKATGGLGAGPGQEAFSGFLREAVAERITARGGFGLSEGIYRALALRAGLEETAPTPASEPSPEPAPETAS